MSSTTRSSPLAAALLLAAVGCGSPDAGPESAPEILDTSRTFDAAVTRDGSSSSCLPQVNADGFGKSEIVSWSMKSFGQFLYVGTLQGGSGGDPESLAAPAGAGGTGTQIWRYDGSRWASAIRDGFGSSDNQGTRNFAVHRGALYAGTLNPKRGAEVWRSVDGTSWTRTAAKGFGDRSNNSVRGMASWRNLLWAGTVNRRGGQLWAYDGSKWRPAAKPGLGDLENVAVAELAVHRDTLFAATWNTHGARVYRFDGTTWVDVVGGAAATPAGFGTPSTTGILSMAVFRDTLYASTLDADQGFSVWRTRDLGKSWQAVITHGAGDPEQRYGWQLYVHDDQLFLGTLTAPEGAPAGTRARHGAELYRSPDGSSWIEEVGLRGQLAPDGVGNGANIGIRALGSFFGDLYLGTAQCTSCGAAATGTEVFRRASDGCGD